MKSNLISIVLLFLTCMTTVSAEHGKPNIIFLLADDAGYADYQPYSQLHDVPRKCRLLTPNVQKLADEGIVFTNAHCTGGVCQPSRYSIMTGLFSTRRLISGNPAEEGENPFIEPERMTIADMLKSQGYQTAMVGKWHLDDVFAEKKNSGSNQMKYDHTEPLELCPVDYGYEYAFWLNKGIGGAKFFIENRYIVKLDGQVDYAELHPDKPAWKGHARWQSSQYAKGQAFEELPGDDRKIIGDVLTDKALEYMETAVKKQKPFFLYFAHIAPHAPHLPNDEVNGVPLDQGAKLADGSVTRLNRQKMVYENDVILGQLNEQLKRLGIEDNTIVIFSSDNGPGMPGVKQTKSAGNFNGWKGTAFEGGNRIPLIIKWPEVVKAGRMSDAMVSQVDLFSTFADILNVDKLPEGIAVDSVSFYPLLKEQAFSGHDYLYSSKHKIEPYMEYENGGRNVGMLSRHNEKLIIQYLHQTDTFKPVEYYDLNSDPGETKNLIALPQYKKIIDTMMDEFHKMQNKNIVIH